MAKVFFSLILAVAAIAHSFAQTPAPVRSERELRVDLFRGYDKNSRPVKSHSSVVTVKMSLTPLALRSMDVKNELISLEAWMMMNWTDEYLKWDPSEYDGIKVIRVSPNELWRPDISLYAASPDTSIHPVVQTQALVYNTGGVLWVPPFTINSKCPTPFCNNVTTGRQFIKCTFCLGSWTYSGDMMDIQLATDKVDLTNFMDYHHEYKLVKIVSKRVVYQPCCSEGQPIISYNITLTKRNYYTNPEVES